MQPQVRSVAITLAAGLVLAGVLVRPAPAAEMKDIVDTAVAAGSFKTLVQAVETAGLVDVLKGPGPYTVFAPTDEAFAKVPKADLDALLKDKTRLSKVLQYHVLTSRWTAGDLQKVKSTGTVEGQHVKIDAAGKALKINDASVVKPDVAAANGMIHVIDTVLMPPK